MGIMGMVSSQVSVKAGVMQRYSQQRLEKAFTIPSGQGSLIAVNQLEPPAEVLQPYSPFLGLPV